MCKTVTFSPGNHFLGQLREKPAGKHSFGVCRISLPANTALALAGLARGHSLFWRLQD
jgi:hypothetical protein